MEELEMTFPFALQLGSYEILLHTIFESAGYFIGFRYFLYLRKKQGDTIPVHNRIWIFIASIFGAIAGSRLVGGLEDIEGLQSARSKLLYFYQNKTVLGGLLGGLVVVELVKKILKEKHSSGDLITYPFIVALIIGRIGCFSMGVYENTYGTVTSLVTGMDLGDGLARHPVCLYEIGFLLLLLIMLALLEKRYVLSDGARFKLFMITYLCFRFLLDFIKPHYTFTIRLSTIQIAALLGLLYYAEDIIYLKRLVTKKCREDLRIKEATDQGKLF
ncbi:MAG TPA: prolipoprotein diacylglyceryl transferase family protein [Segetibacter sp.]